MSEIFSGKCLCGQTAYKIEGIPRAMFLCHCSRCRKDSGSAYGANIFFEKGTLAWIKGMGNLRLFRLEGTRKSRAFCFNCGSPLPRQEGEGVVLPAGTLDLHLTIEPTAHIYFASRAAWEDKLKDLSCFDSLPR